MNIRWAMLVEGYAAQLYRDAGGCWLWPMLREEAKREWRAAARGRLRRGLWGFGRRPVTPQNLERDRT